MPADQAFRAPESMLRSRERPNVDDLGGENAPSWSDGEVFQRSWAVSIFILSAANPAGLVRAFCDCVSSASRDTELPKRERALGIGVPGHRIKDGTWIAARKDRHHGAQGISFRERRAPDSW